MIVQNYNSILTLSHLYRSSDALLVHENDAIHKICAKLMNIKQISFRDINQVVAHQLGSVFQPTYSAEGSSHYRRNPLGITPLMLLASKSLRSSKLMLYHLLLSAQSILRFPSSPKPFFRPAQGSSKLLNCPMEKF